jgi:hypothetical protein
VSAGREKGKDDIGRKSEAVARAAALLCPFQDETTFLNVLVDPFYARVAGVGGSRATSPKCGTHVTWI